MPIALVTGGAAGIGAAIAEALAGAGARVVIADRDAATGTETARRLDATFLPAELATIDGARELMAAAPWPLDVLVNNAGGFTPPTYPTAPLSRWLEALDLNLRSVMVTTQLAIEAMRGRGGSIVNIASTAGLGHGPHPSPEYAVAKAGVVRLTACLAPLRESDGIRVNCVCPDLVDTPSSRREAAGMSPEKLAARPPAMAPGEIAEAVLDLVRDERLAGRAVVCQRAAPRRVLLPATDWRSYVAELATGIHRS